MRSKSTPLISKNILVFGTFDYLHPGHKFVLDEAHKHGTVHVVVARDSTVELIKGEKPDHDEHQRKEAIEKQYPDAKVILGDTNDYMKPIQEVEPDLILMGYDQKLPPGLTEADLPCPVERLASFEPEKYKSSLLRKSQDAPSVPDE